MILNAELPDLSLNVTPDVYNGLVNLHRILTSSDTATESIIALKAEKDRVLINCSYQSLVYTKGIKKMQSYWEAYYMILSGSYLYFY